MDVNSSVVVCGGGGFIGGHLVGDLLRKGFKNVRCVDVKPTSEWYQVHRQAENVVADLNLRDDAFERGQGLRRSSTTSPATWAAWASSRTTRACA